MTIYSFFRPKHLLPILSVLSTFYGATAHAQSIVTAAPENAQYRLSISQAGTSVVRDRRTVSLPAGRSLVRFNGVAAKLDANSVQPLISGGKANVLEQRFRHDTAITEQAILRRYVGQTVTLLRDDQPPVKGTLLSTEGATLLDTADGLLINPRGTFLVPKLGDPIATEPFLEWHLDTATAGPYNIDARYATEGLRWQANYRALFNTAGDRMSFNSWLSLSNDSGANFKQAQIAISGYPDVKITQPVDLIRGETRQLSYFSAEEIPVTTEFVFYAADAQNDFTKAYSAPPQLMVRLPNTAAAGLGLELLPGQLNVWRTAEDGSLQRLATRPLMVLADRVWIPRGSAGNVSVLRSAAVTRQLNPVTREHTVQIAVTNTRSSEVTVSVVEQLPYNAKLTETSIMPYIFENGLAEFKVTVPAGETVTLKYSVEVKN